MTTTSLHPMAADYLERLRHASRRLPRSRRDELVAEIEAHLVEAVGPHGSTAEALTVLDRLGEPEAIVEAEQPRRATTADPRGLQEWAAIFLLLFGGFVFGVGWLAGLIFLWGSRAWTTRDKWIGTLFVPGGLATGALVLLFVGGSSSESCFGVEGGQEQCVGGTSTGTDILLMLVVVVSLLGPIATAAYLARRAGKVPTAT
jgi:hypothetical protein